MACFYEPVNRQRILDVIKNINNLFDPILQRVRDQGVHDYGLIRAHINRPNSIRHGDIVVSLRPFAEMTSDAIISALIITH